MVPRSIGISVSKTVFAVDILTTWNGVPFAGRIGSENRVVLKAVSVLEVLLDAICPDASRLESNCRY